MQQRYKVSNVGPVTPRVIHDARGRPVSISPGQTVEVEIKNDIIDRHRAMANGLEFTQLGIEVREVEPERPVRQRVIEERPAVSDDDDAGTRATRETPEERRAADKMDVPENWDELSWPQLRSLAAKVSNRAISTRADAEKAIRAELKRRKRQ